MLRMAVGHSDDIDADLAARIIVDQCLESLGGVAPKAGLLFSAWETDHGAVLGRLREALPGIELIGSTSAAQMSSEMGFQEDSVTLALFASDDVDITGGLATDLWDDVPAAAHAAIEQARAKSGQEPKLCITTPSAGGDMRALLDALRDELGPDVPVIGGGAAPRSNRHPTRESWQFYGDRSVSDALPVLLFSGPLTYSFGTDAGWRPIGPKGRVTRAEGSAVQEIDGKPALSFYERYLGEGFEPAFATPLAVFAEGSERFYLRAPVHHDPETGTVTVSGDVQQGTEVQLTTAATEEIFDGARSALTQAIDQFPDGHEPEAALIFSCAIRKYLLGTRTGTEYDILQEMLGGGMPVCGFYSFGEIAPLDEGGETRYHNETMVALLLGSS
ncbi:MAG: FIST N-terminal domain-containing protein [Actinomycetota bacterium]